VPGCPLGKNGSIRAHSASLNQVNELPTNSAAKTSKQHFISSAR
jgi:hypothetical protein